MYRDINRRSIQRKSRVGLARLFHPVNVLLRSLRKKKQHPLTQFTDSAIELRQLLPCICIVRFISQLHQRLAHPLKRQSQRVVDQLGTAHAQLLPRRIIVGTVGSRLGLLFAEFVTGDLKLAKKLLHRRLGILDHARRLAGTQQAKQPFASLGIPQPLQIEAHLPARHAHAHVLRRHVADVVRLVEDHEIIVEQYTLILVLGIILAAIVAQKAEEK